MPRILLGDTMGELRKFYALASVVFVGRSLVPLGGSDPMEVAALGKPIVTGPHMENFTQAVTALGACGALVQGESPQAVLDQVLSWLIGPSAAQAAGRGGQQVVRANQGATPRTVGWLVELAGSPTGEVGA